MEDSRVTYRYVVIHVLGKAKAFWNLFGSLSILVLQVVYNWLQMVGTLPEGLFILQADGSAFGNPNISMHILCALNDFTLLFTSTLHSCKILTYFTSST